MKRVGYFAPAALKSRRKEKKNYAGSKTLPASIKEKEARSAVSLPHQAQKYC
jgi:hypothetical protein